MATDLPPPPAAYVGAPHFDEEKFELPADRSEGPYSKCGWRYKEDTSVSSEEKATATFPPGKESRASQMVFLLFCVGCFVLISWIFGRLAQQNDDNRAQNVESIPIVTGSSGGY